MAKKISSVSELLNIRNISGNILYTKDNYIMCYVRVKPIVVSIMGDIEKWSLTDSLTNSFSTEKEPITILKIDRPIDIKNIVTDYQKKISDLRKSSHLKVGKTKKDILTSNMMYLDKYARDGQTLENLYYLQFYKKFDGENEETLLSRAYNFVRKLKMSNIESYLIMDSEIKELCSIFANLGYASREIDEYSDELSVISRYYTNQNGE